MRYDAGCRRCRIAVRAVAALDRRGALRFVPIPDDAPPEAWEAIHLVDDPARGWDAIVRMAESVPVLRPLAWVDRVPLLRRSADALYRTVARTRLSSARGRGRPS